MLRRPAANLPPPAPLRLPGAVGLVLALGCLCGKGKDADDEGGDSGSADSGGDSGSGDSGGGDSGGGDSGSGDSGGGDSGGDSGSPPPSCPRWTGLVDGGWTVLRTTETDGTITETRRSVTITDGAVVWRDDTERSGPEAFTSTSWYDGRCDGDGFVWTRSEYDVRYADGGTGGGGWSCEPCPMYPQDWGPGARYATACDCVPLDADGNPGAPQRLTYDFHAGEEYAWASDAGTFDVIDVDLGGTGYIVWRMDEALGLVSITVNGAQATEIVDWGP